MMSSNLITTLQGQVKELMKHLEATKSELALYQGKYAQSVQAYQQLLAAFKQIQRRQFGAQSERFLDKTPRQGDLFSDIPAFHPEQETAENPAAESTSLNQEGHSKPPARRSRQSKDHQHFAKNLLRREVIIPAEKPAGDNQLIRYEITELLHYVPPIYEVIIQKREVWVTKDKTTNVSTITIAPNPKRLLPKAQVTESFLAHTIVSKLYDRQPLYHLEKMYGERFDFICPRNKLARWFIESAKQMQPLVNLLKDTILDDDVAFCDPTHLQVLDEPLRPPTASSYVFTIKGGPPDKMAVVYEYNPDQHKSFLMEWFADYQGYLHVDGQNIFEVFKDWPGVELLYCNAHARRKFEPIAKASQRPGLAHEAMRFYQKLYEIEREAKQNQLTPAARYELRQVKSKPLIEAFETWVKKNGPLTLPQSPLGKAMEYVQKRLCGLSGFLADGRLEIDTNSLEQKNKDLALTRNNFLFCQSVEGARALSIHLSLVVTAVMHGHDPYDYYVRVMQALPNCTTVDQIEKLLPWHMVSRKQKIVEAMAAAA